MIIRYTNAEIEFLLIAIGWSLTIYGVIWFAVFLKAALGDGLEAPTRWQVVRRCIYFGLGIGILRLSVLLFRV